MAASHGGRGNALTDLATVFVCRYPFADAFQRRRHIGDSVLIKLGEQFSSPTFPKGQSIEIGKGSNTAASGRRCVPVSAATQR
jgi:hypothetical protein